MKYFLFSLTTGFILSLSPSYADMGVGTAEYCPKESDVQKLFTSTDSFNQALKQNSFKINGTWHRILTNDSERAKLMKVKTEKVKVSSVTNHEMILVGIAKSLGLSNGTCLYLVDDGAQKAYLNIQKKKTHK